MSQTLISCPIELIKTRAQLRAQPVMTCLRETIRKEGGLRALYRGYGATLARDAPAFAMYFACYELLLKMSVSKKSDSPSTLLLLMAGGTAGAVSWLASYPLDVIKSRIQADTTYRSMRHCARHSLSQEGVNVFVRGMTPTLVRAFPTNGATFAVVTWTLWSYETYYCDDNHTKSGQNVLE
ncbi:unnamed protein product, partial [Oppiella nova]